VPTYDYECPVCANRLEVFQSMSDPPLRKCPKCGKRRLKRLIGAGAGVIFKGTGFYTTDYRSSSYAASKKSDVEPAAKSETKTEAKSETSAKPASATDGGQSSPASPSPAPATKPSKKK
jgi:putative FmdB family regulatory protein